MRLKTQALNRCKLSLNPLPNIGVMSLKNILEALQNWLLKRTLKGKVFLFVLSVHLLLLGTCQVYSMTQRWIKPTPEKKHVMVSTVKLKPAPVAATVKTASPTIKKEKETSQTQAAAPVKGKKESPSKPKVVDKKTAASKKEPVKKAESTQASRPAYVSSEVQKALKSLEAVQSPTLSNSHFDFSNEGQEELDESMRLAAFIRAWLKLPEFGKVTVRIKLNSEGKVLSLETLQSESATNQKYVEQNLCLLTLPVAKNTTTRHSERSLVLVLSNE